MAFVKGEETPSYIAPDHLMFNEYDCRFKFDELYYNAKNIRNSGTRFLNEVKQQLHDEKEPPNQYGINKWNSLSSGMWEMVHPTNEPAKDDPWYRKEAWEIYQEARKIATDNPGAFMPEIGFTKIDKEIEKLTEKLLDQAFEEYKKCSCGK